MVDHDRVEHGPDGERERQPEEDRVRPERPCERERARPLDDRVPDDRADREDPLEHGPVDLVPDRLLERPELAVVQAERVLGVGPRARETASAGGC